MQFRSSKLIFVVKRLLKLGNLAQKVPHLAIWHFYNNICNNYSSEELFKWGNYSREEIIQGRKLLIIRRFWLRKLFKGGNYSREETIWGNTVSAISDRFFLQKLKRRPVPSSIKFSNYLKMSERFLTSSVL